MAVTESCLVFVETHLCFASEALEANYVKCRRRLARGSEDGDGGREAD